MSVSRGERRLRPSARAGLVVLTAFITLSCGVSLVRLPAGPGAPAPDASTAITEATSVCRAVASITAAVSVRGSLGGRRLRGRLDVGLAPPSSARLEAVAPFGLVFTFVARGDDATLVLHRDGRVLEHGRSGAVIEALTGIPLDASDLRMALMGCAEGLDASQARQLGEDWRVAPQGPNLVYLRREPGAGPWRLVAAIHREPGRPEWRAEYDEFENGLPRTIRFASSDPGRFNLRLELSQVDITTPLGIEAFEVKIPSSADPITLEELRRLGPLASSSSDSDGR